MSYFRSHFILWDMWAGTYAYASALTFIHTHVIHVHLTMIWIVFQTYFFFLQFVIYILHPTHQRSLNRDMSLRKMWTEIGNEYF